MSSSCASDAFDSESTMRDLVVSGRQAHENAVKTLEHALEFFTKVVNKCPCGKGVERRRCTCKNYEQVAGQGGSIFKEAMYTCHCDVGREFNKCDNMYHIQALDFQAITFEALGKLDHAVKNAEWILELAPRLPDGYLRLGNLARLQKNDKYAGELYAAGIEVNKETAAEPSPKSQQLYTLYRHVLRQDPLCLPAEIVSHIFSVVLRVSTEWTRKLTSPVHRNLWRNVDFPHLWFKPYPRLDHLQKIFSWAGEGGVKKIVIKDCSEIPEPILTYLLELSPGLEHLEIYYMPCQGLPAHKNKWTQLRHVSLSGQALDFMTHEVDCDGGFPQTFLQNAASSLEHLDFVGIPEQWYRGLVPDLPQLKTLRIGGNNQAVTPFPIFHLSVGFPRLVQLWIGPVVPYLVLEPAGTWRTRWGEVWPHLKVLKFHDWEPDPEEKEMEPEEEIAELEIMESEREETRLTLRYLMALYSLQHISIKLEGGDWPCKARTEPEDLLSYVDIVQHSDFRNLRSFELPSFSITPDGGRILLSKAIMAKQLTSFDLVFPKGRYESLIHEGPFTNETFFEDPYTEEDPDTVEEDPHTIEEDPCTIEEKSIRHLNGYEWLCGTPSIHTLGLYDFRFPEDVENDENSPLLRFLATFPNLRTLKINSREYKTPDFVSLVVSIMRVTHLQTIYTTCVGGEFLDQLRETAQEHGVQLMSRFPEQQWPMPLESSIACPRSKSDLATCPSWP
ncbi:uncharacterized protein CPUR_03101 [Claviceps purpurea 20.1]|uniref:Uncharacterized protein n=1 Tax=Claviceps purpurea (strain 20.1) TaxID=1111077 RepID=M1W8Q1_CLAP2|nr:uncharacterized protein CPUR_03101 [Claviceps purpurea 20.1]